MENVCNHPADFSPGVSRHVPVNLADSTFVPSVINVPTAVTFVCPRRTGAAVVAVYPALMHALCSSRLHATAAAASLSLSHLPFTCFISLNYSLPFKIDDPTLYFILKPRE